MISDHVVTKFLNNFIDLTEYDFKEYQGHINVKTHYNAFKKDVIFTYYKDIRTKDDEWKTGTTWSLCYNIATNKGVFTTFYDWYPVESCNIDNIFFSLNKEDLDAVYNRSNENYIRLFIDSNNLIATDDNTNSMAYYEISKYVIDP
jgi:hypothetical protein